MPKTSVTSDRNNLLGASVASAHELIAPVNLAELVEKISGETKQSRDRVFGNIAKLYQEAAKVEYGCQYDFWLKLAKDGQPALFQVLTVVQDVTDGNREVSLENARRAHPDVELGYLVSKQVAVAHPEGLPKPVKMKAQNLKLIAA